MNHRDMTFVQLFVAGVCFDIEEADWNEFKVRAMDRRLPPMYEFMDIYGARVEVVTSKIESARTYTPEAGKNYRDAHEDHQNDVWS